MEKYSISQAARKGVAAIVKEAEKDGFVLLERSENPIAIVVPLSISGYSKFTEFLIDLDSKDLLEYGKDNKLYDFIYVMRKLNRLVEDTVSFDKILSDSDSIHKFKAVTLAQFKELMYDELVELSKTVFEEFINSKDGVKILNKL